MQVKIKIINAPIVNVTQFYLWDESEEIFSTLSIENVRNVLKVINIAGWTPPKADAHFFSSFQIILTLLLQNAIALWAFLWIIARINYILDGCLS